MEWPVRVTKLLNLIRRGGRICFRARSPNRQVGITLLVIQFQRDVPVLQAVRHGLYLNRIEPYAVTQTVSLRCIAGIHAGSLRIVKQTVSLRRFAITQAGRHRITPQTIKHPSRAARLGTPHSLRYLGNSLLYAVGNLPHPRVNRLLKFAGGKIVVDESPLLRAFSFQSFGQSRKHIGAVTANSSLIDQASQTTGPGKHTKQGNFGKGNSGVAVVNKIDFIAGDGQLVAAAGSSAVQSCEIAPA